MKKNASMFALVFAIAVIALAIWPVSGRSSAAETTAATPIVFLADMNNQVCAAQTQVHTTASKTTARAAAGLGGVAGRFAGLSGRRASVFALVFTGFSHAGHDRTGALASG